MRRNPNLNPLRQNLLELRYTMRLHQKNQIKEANKIISIKILNALKNAAKTNKNAANQPNHII